MTFNTNITNSSAILPPEFGALVQGPIEATSLAFNPAVATVIQTNTHELRIPILAADPIAAWTTEGAEIETSAPALAEVNLYFAKVAGLTSITREMANDSSPAAQSIAGDGLARDIARKIDAAFFGDLEAPAPSGLGSITPTKVDGVLDSLDVFAEAIAAAKTQGASVTSFVVNPADALTVRKLKTATGAITPLLGPDATTVTGSQVFGIPMLESTDVPVGTAWAIDANAVTVGQRQGIELAVSEQ